MGVSYMVRGRTESECQQALDALCRLLGAVQTTRPVNPGGRGWVARAVPATAEAPDQTVRGLAVR